MSEAVREPLGMKMYRAASRVAGPLARVVLNRRARAGKEDLSRISERRGYSDRQRPDGPLVWIHGASVGESLSIIPLVEHLLEKRPALHFLVTTGTVTSAAMMEKRLPAGAFHQYIPLDLPVYVDAFLDHWRPDAALFVESEFWPNLILGARRRATFMALINGRVSPSSYDSWRRQPRAIKFLLSKFDAIVAQDHQNAERLMTLAAREVDMFGNLKNAAPPLPADEAEIEHLRATTAGRTVWLAASTQPGEEETIFAAHQLLKAEYPNLLTIIAPRHPHRGEEVASIAQDQGLKSARRATSQPIEEITDVYIADTLGELGIFYRLTDIAFVGGGIIPKGGHNPLEPARLGAAILHGPHTFNFVETYSDMRKTGGAALVRNERDLATALRRLFADSKTRAAMAAAAKHSAEQNAEKVLNDLSATLIDRIDAAVGAS